MSNIDIVFEHTDFLVVNKPSGLSMHGQGDGIVSVLEQQTGLSKLFLVHRLDTPTSGCLLLAKSSQAAAALSSLFSQRLINKYYLAISDKKPKKKQGKVVGDMLKSRSGNYKLSQSIENPAATLFISEALCSLGDINKNQASQSPNLRLFYVKPISGKTHQIRVALKSLGAPILGDIRYKGTDSDRLYLHSHVLAFEYKQAQYRISSLPQTGSFFTNDTFNDKVTDPRYLIDTLSWPKYKLPLLKQH